ncbi:MAG: 5'/3'-nucleotidase SurE, partial [Gaiellales bacterium]
TAQNFGLPGLAVSLERAPVLSWKSAAAVAVDVLEWLGRLPPRSVINLNVPSLHREAVRGIRWATLDAFGLVQTASAQAGGEMLQFTFEARTAEPDPRSDTALVRDGYAAVTALIGVSEAEAPAVEPPRVTVRPIAGAPHVLVEDEGPATGLALGEADTDET